MVIDLKFGRREDRESEVADNTALQLAVYGFLITGDDLTPAPGSAFYILTSHRWITGDGGVFDVAPVRPGKYGMPDMKTCWNQFQNVWRWRRDQLKAGKLEVTYTGTEPTPESVPPHEAWGPVDNNGKYSDYVKLAGWKEGA